MATTDAISAVCDTFCYLLWSSMTVGDSSGGTLGNSSGNGMYAPRGLVEILGPDKDSTFAVCTSQDLSDTAFTGDVPRVGVFLYRVVPNSSNRNLTGRLDESGHRQLNQLSLDLHILVFVWAQHAETQHRLVGWVMRTLEDYPILPASVLNLGAREVMVPPDVSENGNGNGNGNGDGNSNGNGNGTPSENQADNFIFREEDESVELLLSEIGSDELLQLWDTLGKGSVPFPIAIPYLVRNVCIESYRYMEPERSVQERVADMARAEGGRV
jgi:hypothetical protein